MAEMSQNQFFHLLLADIAMAAAIVTAGSTYETPVGAYQPGALRDGWLAGATDEYMKRRVMALANAGVASLQGVDPDQLAKAAAKYNIPIDSALADVIALHFNNKREAIIRYRS